MKEILARFHALDHEDTPNQYLNQNEDDSDSDHEGGEDDDMFDPSSMSHHQQQRQLQLRDSRGQQGGFPGGGGDSEGTDSTDGDSGSDGDGEEGGRSDGAAGTGPRVAGVDPVADALSEETLQRLFIKVGEGHQPPEPGHQPAVIK